MVAPRKLEGSLQDAIDHCLAGCYRNDSPMLRLAECLDDLRACGWDDDGLRHIELVVLKRLVGVSGPPGEAEHSDAAPREDAPLPAAPLEPTLPVATPLATNSTPTDAGPAR